MTQHTIETERLHLRLTTIEDVEFIFELVNMPKWKLYIGDRNVKTLESAKKYIEIKIRPQIDQLGYGNYTVIRKSDGIKIGSCGLYNREGIEGIDIGFSFLPAYENQGYAYESSKKLLNIGMTEFNLNLVNAITMRSNESSQKLLEKLGLKFVKMIKLVEGDNELMLFSLII